MRFFRFLLLAFACIAAAVGAVAFWQRRALNATAANVLEATQGSEWASKLGTADGVLDYLAAHRQDVSLATWTVGDEDGGVFLNPDQLQPIASTVKILVLAEYAAQVESGALLADAGVQVAEWDALYLPGTDGDAHPHALGELASRGLPADGGVAWREIAGAMIRHSDNAATDLLLLRFGRARVAGIPGRLGEPELPAPRPIGGSMLVWREGAGEPGDRLEAWMANPVRYVDQTWATATRLATDARFRSETRASLASDGIGLGLAEQEAFAQGLDDRGTARGYARIMERVVRDQVPGARVMREYLEWPMRNRSMREAFDAFGTKGGSLPGIVTSASYAKPKGGARPRVLALFIRQMPFLAWGTLMRTFAQQDFERKLLSDEAYVEVVRKRLDPR